MQPTIRSARSMLAASIGGALRIGLILPLARPVFDPGLVLLRMDHRHLEVEPVLSRDLAHNIGQLLKLRLAAPAAAGAGDDDRRVVFDRRAQHQPQVALSSLPWS